MNIKRPDGRRGNLVVFSDLDQTLLDGKDYSHDKAVPGLTLLEDRKIPLVLCTSKTRKEVEFYRGRLKNYHPFVIENGGAVYIPIDYFGFDFDYHHRTDGFFVVELGTPYPAIIRALSRLKRKTGLSLRGFSDMTVQEVATRCDLPLHQAAWAKQREYDEPFLIPDPDEVTAVINAADIPVSQGGRFFHLASSDKGRAVSMLMSLFKRSKSDAVSVGIGDALNDLQLLEAVDIPVLVQDADGGYDPRISFSDLRYAEGIGPVGWNSAIESLVDGSPTRLIF